MQISLKEYFENLFKKLSWQITGVVGLVLFFIFVSLSSYFYISRVNDLSVYFVPQFTYWIQVGDSFQISRTIDSLELSDKSLTIIVSLYDLDTMASSDDRIFLDFDRNGVYLNKRVVVKTEKGKNLGHILFKISIPILNFFSIIFFLLVFMKIILGFFLRRIIQFSRELVDPIEKSLLMLNSFNLNSSYLRPVSDDQSKILEFNLLSNTIINLYERIDSQQRQIDVLNARELKSEIASQVAHDIRSPLSILKNIRNEISGLSKEGRLKFLLSVKRIEEISNSLLNSNQELFFYPLEITSFLQEVINEKRLEFEGFQQLEIVENFDNDLKLYSSVDPSVLARVISNLINNSKDAMSTIGCIHITAEEIDTRILIRVIDHGPGIPESIRSSLFKKGVTSKINGNGLGLYGARKDLSLHEGELDLEKTDHTGTIFRISLKKAISQRFVDSEICNEVVLIDDDKLIKYDWFKFLESKGIRLKIFSSVSEFISVQDEISKDAEIFIDSNLGPSILGEVESEKIANLGYRNLYLSTSYEMNQLSKPPWIKEIYPKNPREIFIGITSLPTI